MRRTLIALVLVFIAAISALLLALRSESFVLDMAHWAVNSFSSLELKLVNPSVDFYGGRLTADQLHLKPEAADAPALLSVLGLSAGLFGNEDAAGSSVIAESVLIYVSESDDTDDPQPLQWLGYLRWLPSKLSIGWVHLVTESENTWIFPLKGLRGERHDNGRYQLGAEADYEGEPLGITLDLLAVDQGRGVAAAQTRIRLVAPLSGSEMMLAGAMKGNDEFFNYHFNLDASYTDIRELLKGFEDTVDLAGALRLKGTLVGDTTGFVLSEATFTLDNKPEYSFDADGWLNYRMSGESGLQLNAEGEMASMEYLVDWLDLNLGELGAAKGTIQLSGSLTAPVIESFKLVTESEAGLVVGISGRLNLYDAVEDRDSRENSLAVELHGPSLAVLEEWLGEIWFEPGPWRASGQLTGYQGDLSLRNVALEAGSPETVELRASGAIGKIVRPPGPDTGYTVEDIMFRVEAASPDSAALANLFELEGIPPHHSVQVALDVSGTGKELQLKNAYAVVSASDLDATVGPLSAVLHPGQSTPLRQLAGPVLVEMSDVSALSQYTSWPVPVLGPLKMTATLAQKDNQYQLLDVVAGFGEGDTRVETTGRIGTLTPLGDVSLTTKIIGLDTRTLISTLTPTLGGGKSLGAIGGFFKLTGNNGVWNVSALELASGNHKTPAQLALNGSIADLTGARSGNLEAQFRLTDAALLNSIGGMAMAPVSGNLKFVSSKEQLRVTLRSHVGATSINADATVAVSGDAISGISLAVDTPHLYLQDFGFLPEEETEPDETNEPAETLPALLRRIAPPYPVTMSLGVGGISGDYSSFDSLELRVSGHDNLYTLEEFSTRYKQALTEIRGIVDLNPVPPALSLAGRAIAIPLGGLLKDVGIQSNVSGALTVQGGITMRGDTRESLIGSLNGSIAFALEDAVIAGAAYDLLATDLLAWIYSGALTEKSTHLDCTMAKFQLREGVATSDSLYIESSRMLATGSAKFDLVKQRMDLRITPKSKSRLVQVPSEVRLKGDMSNPKADVSAITAVADATTSALMLVPNLTLRLFGLDTTSSKNYRPCHANLGNQAG